MYLQTDGVKIIFSRVQNVILMKVLAFLPLRNHETNQPCPSIDVTAADDQSKDSGEEKEEAGEYILDIF